MPGGHGLLERYTEGSGGAFRGFNRRDQRVRAYDAFLPHELQERLATAVSLHVAATATMTVAAEHVTLVRDNLKVKEKVGAGIGTAVGAGIGTIVGAGIGTAVGAGIGTSVGAGFGPSAELVKYVLIVEFPGKWLYPGYWFIVAAPQIPSLTLVYSTVLEPHISMNDFDTEIQALNAAIIEFRVNVGWAPNPFFSFWVILSLFVTLAILSDSGGFITLFVFLGIFISYFALFFFSSLLDKNEKKMMETISLLLDQLTTKYQSTGLIWYLKTETVLVASGDNRVPATRTIRRTLVIRHGPQFSPGNSHMDCKIGSYERTGVVRYEVDVLGLHGCILHTDVPCIISTVLENEGRSKCYPAKWCAERDVGTSHFKVIWPGGIRVRPKPTTETKMGLFSRGTEVLGVGSVFAGSEVLRPAGDNATFVKLADGRGWVCVARGTVLSAEPISSLEPSFSNRAFFSLTEQHFGGFQIIRVEMAEQV